MGVSTITRLPLRSSSSGGRLRSGLSPFGNGLVDRTRQLFPRFDVAQFNQSFK